jgi:hypothetical protein
MPRIPAAATKPQPQPEPAKTAPAENPPVVKPTAVIEIQIESVTIERLPLGEVPTGHVSRDLRTHLNKLLTPVQSIAVARLTGGLRQTATKLADGRPVIYNADAVCWLLEQIAAA